jgi:hypothetical protein
VLRDERIMAIPDGGLELRRTRTDECGKTVVTTWAKQPAPIVFEVSQLSDDADFSVKESTQRPNNEYRIYWMREHLSSIWRDKLLQQAEHGRRRSHTNFAQSFARFSQKCW